MNKYDYVMTITLNNGKVFEEFIDIDPVFTGHNFDDVIKDYMSRFQDTEAIYFDDEKHGTIILAREVAAIEFNEYTGVE